MRYILVPMKKVSANEFARNARQVLEVLERDQEEVVVVRNRHVVARLVPEPPAQTADEVLDDLVGILDDETGHELTEAVRKVRKKKRGTLKELRNPWAT